MVGKGVRESDGAMKRGIKKRESEASGWIKDTRWKQAEEESKIE